MSALKITSGRPLVLLSAILWSTSGLFTKLLPVGGPVIAFYRTLIAALFLSLFLLSRPRFVFRARHLVLVLSFAGMNITFVTAMTMTSSANAIFLQYTAPIWMTLFCVVILKERLDRPSLISLGIGMLGVAFLLSGEWRSDPVAIGLGLLSGVFFAGVALCLRESRTEDGYWLTFLEMAGSAIVLLPYILLTNGGSGLRLPAHALGILVLFGTIQLAIPYLIFARGVRTVSAQEAGIILLLEPVLNPLWTFLFLSEVPSRATMIGGAFLVLSLLTRGLMHRS